MAQLQVRKLTLIQTKQIYDTYMRADFPPEELKPFYMIEDMWKRGHYFAYGFYETVQADGAEGDLLRAYAFLVADNNKQMLLLDYFAACANARGQGYGSIALGQLKEACGDWRGIIIEVEDNELELEENIRNIRNRRIAFYTRNGCHMTDTRSRVFGVDYRIMILPVTDERAGEGMAQKVTGIYRCMHNEELLEKNFKITAE
ncbi:MAG: N-acetyltransferase [Lachnospiraceae bacterium]|nr:N-acetyltransferase [Lachnospiraceae bacterium]